LPTIVSKVSNAVKHDLTKNQQAIVINLLHDFQNLSTATTTDDLMMMAGAYSTYERRERMQKALEKYAPGLCERMTNSQQEELILVIKELEKIDLHNKPFNLFLRFMCQCACFTPDIDLMARIDFCGNKSALFLQKCCKHVVRTITIPFVVFNDCYFFRGWQKEFEKFGSMFLVLNPFSSALLKSIKHQ